MKSIKTIKIFISSSSELLYDVREIGILNDHKNRLSVSKEILFQLISSENLEIDFSVNSIKEVYNKAFLDCHIFILLFYTKIGAYTFDEFKLVSEISKKSNTN